MLYLNTVGLVIHFLIYVSIKKMATLLEVHQEQTQNLGSLTISLMTNWEML